MFFTQGNFEGQRNTSCGWIHMWSNLNSKNWHTVFVTQGDLGQQRNTSCGWIHMWSHPRSFRRVHTCVYLLALSHLIRPRTTCIRIKDCMCVSVARSTCICGKKYMYLYLCRPCIRVLWSACIRTRRTTCMCSNTAWNWSWKDYMNALLRTTCIPLLRTTWIPLLRTTCIHY